MGAFNPRLWVISLALWALILGAIWTCAKADQYDAALHYASLAALKADPDLRRWYFSEDDAFDLSSVTLIKVWRNSQDTVDGDGNVVHNFMNGIFILISADHLIPALRDNPALQVVLNRDRCNGRLPGCVIRSNVSGALLQDIRFAPIFVGSDYLWGGLN